MRPILVPFALFLVAMAGIGAFTRQLRGDEALASKVKAFSQPPEKFATDFGNYKSPLVFDDGGKVKNAADWTRRRQEIKTYWTNAMGVWPKVAEKPKFEVLKKEDLVGGITQSYLRIEVAPGVITEDAILLVPNGKGPFPAVVVVFYDAKTGVGQGKSPQRDFALQLAKRGYVALSVGSPPGSYYPRRDKVQIQPLAYHAVVAAHCHAILAQLDTVDARLIGIVGHSYGGKWALFAACFYEQFACACWSDPGIVFDEKRSNVNYWEPWYLGHEQGKNRKPGIIKDDNPRQGVYKKLIEEGRDLHELHALMAPRPFLVSGGAEDQASRWIPLNHSIAVNRLLGYEGRVAMTNRPGHSPTDESNEQMMQWFDYWLKNKKVLQK